MGRKQEVSPGSRIFCTQDQYFDYVIKPRNTNSKEPYRRPPGAASECGSPRGQFRYSSLHYVLPNSATKLPAISWKVTTLCIAYLHSNTNVPHCHTSRSSISTAVTIFLKNILHLPSTIRLLLLLVFSPWAGLGRDQSSVRRLVWLWYAASWASS